MKLLINFATLKKGGGQNVGLNFISGLQLLSFNDIEFFFVAAKGSQIEKMLIDKRFSNVLSLPSSPLKRILKEISLVNKYIKRNKIDAVYSCFGFSFVNRRICQVCGVADSNLLYPKIDFWEGYSGISRVKKRIIDGYRRWGYKRASGLIFENSAMEARAKTVFGKKTNSIYIKPSFSIMDCDGNSTIKVDNSAGFKCLFFCGWQRNKGILMIPDIIKKCRDSNIIIDVYISTSIDVSDPICAEFMKKSNDYLSNIHFLGAVNKSQIKSLYEQMDFVFLLSKLESFSNNIIEAWYYKKPLIIADEEWSHSICNDAALYVDRTSADAIVDALTKAISDNEFDNIVNEGIREFSKYPTIEEKVEKEIEYVKKICYLDKV